MTPHDDDSIASEDLLIRRISREHHVVYDHTHECFRVSSKAFSPSSGLNGGMSIDLPKLMMASGIEPREYVTNPSYIGSVTFRSSIVRGLGLLVGSDPKPDNPYHGQVWANNRVPNKFTRAEQAVILGASEWFVPIPNVELIS